MTHEKKVSLLNHANVLTISRIFLTLVFLFLVQSRKPSHLFWAWFVFIIAAVTDLYDGRMAREKKIVTRFGKIADPIADKILIISALVILSSYGIVSWWMSIVIVIREISITIFRFILISRRGIVVEARNLGKWKTTFQFTAMIYSLFALLLKNYFVKFLPHWQKFFTSRFLTFLLPNLLMAIAVFYTLWSAWDYVQEYARGNFRKESLSSSEH